MNIPVLDDEAESMLQCMHDLSTVQLSSSTAHLVSSPCALSLLLTLIVSPSCSCSLSHSLAVLLSHCLALLLSHSLTILLSGHLHLLCPCCLSLSLTISLTIALSCHLPLPHHHPSPPTIKIRLHNTLIMSAIEYNYIIHFLLV